MAFKESKNRDLHDGKHLFAKTVSESESDGNQDNGGKDAILRHAFFEHELALNLAGQGAERITLDELILTVGKEVAVGMWRSWGFEVSED